MRLTQIAKNTVLCARNEIGTFLLNSALLIIVYNLYMDRVIILYPFFLSMSVLLVYLVLKGFALAGFYDRLERAQTSVEDYDCNDALQDRVFEVISEIHQKYLNRITGLQLQINTRNTLFTQFIHGMKSSVSVIELVCEKLGGDEEVNIRCSDINAENEKLKRTLEQVLNLLRLDAFSNDYIPERVDLAALVSHVINEHKRDFIYAGIYPKLNGLSNRCCGDREQQALPSPGFVLPNPGVESACCSSYPQVRFDSAFVYTDSKWCGFIISQLISNAIKYSKPGDNIVFDIERLGERTQLRVTDNGAGIPPGDLPRVFDMFFTGTNGRNRKESTGIGLFMCKHISDRLGIEIGIESEMGRGTTVTLEFLRNCREIS